MIFFSVNVTKMLDHLSNIMLNELDKELTRRGHRFLSICEMETP